jgi:hypothetical protein
MTGSIFKLAAWYERQCVDEWHEDHGVKIDTLDNPGWSLKVDLEGTALEDRPYDDVKIERSENDWIVARRYGSVFEAFGGPRNLDEMINIFVQWAD